ncbi:MAG TPA: hypothetical protein VMM56_04125 [Planctomycetaceae bacterium]|nr:hypothetical protein [Planctomycetaceae bacterium]
MRRLLKILNPSRFHADPREFDNLLNRREHREIKHRLIYESFNAHVNLTTDVGFAENRSHVGFSWK